MTNRLARETSPYLLQHAGNPVDWYPWGDEAFARARAEDRPILLSIGYSACHWCHVMERESFEDADTARLMNERFVSVKVDREERPDVDQIYMEAVQAMTGHGGWPMTVCLTPDGVPFYGGTYFPPVDRQGMPSFRRVLLAISEAWRERRSEVLESGREISSQLNRTAHLRRAQTLLTDEVLFSAFHALSAQFDETWGGTGGAPKFPQPMSWEFVLRFWKRTGNDHARQMVDTTLTRMARGGIYDQLGGGFARYSVDAQWLVPHFEKMLYDNAQLASLYLHAWLAFGAGEYRRVVEETLDYLRDRMTDAAGGFYSAEDADSEGHEGKFYVWTPDEIRGVLSRDEAELALPYWGLDQGPNFEGKHILFVAAAPDPERIAGIRRALFETRERRVRPGRDDKVLASWNGLACRAFAEAGRALGRDDYVAVAVTNADFVLGKMRDRDGRLLRTWKAGAAKLKGYLEDYAMVAAALVDVYEATFDRRWLDEARGLADDMLRLFWDDATEGFYDTGSDHEPLIVRPRNLFDNAVPCGSSVAIETLLRLATLTGEGRYASRATAALRPMADLMARHPGGFGRFLCALDFNLGPVAEVALVWPPDRDPTPLVATVFHRYLPNRVVAGAVVGMGGPEMAPHSPQTPGSGPGDPGRSSGIVAGHGAASDIPLLEGRATIDARPTAYVCRNYTCQLPVTDADELARQLDV